MRKSISMIFIWVMASLMTIFCSIGEAREGLTLWFTFGGSGDTAKDESGTGNNGTIVGATRVSGKHGQGLSIGKQNEYVEISNMLTPQATVEFWFKPNWDGSEADTYRLFGANTGAIYFVIGKGKAVGEDDTTFGFYLEDAADVDFRDWAVPADGTIVADTWYHIAATWDFDAGEAKFYIDGQEVGQVAGLGQFPSLNANPRIGFNVGTGYMPAANGADSIIDEFAIYNRALDADEINQDMIELAKAAVEPAHRFPLMWGEVKAGR